VASVPPARVRAFAAKRLTVHAARELPLRILLPSGTVLGAGAAGSPVLRIRDEEAFWRRLGHGGLIGFGESYQAGEWECDDLTALLTVFASQVGTLIPAPLQRLRAAVLARRPRAERNTLTGARHNIEHHYDLSDEMFALFLDPTMTYSAALFTQNRSGQPVADHGLLALAQQRKIGRLLDQAGVGAGSRVLEIGSGWGQLAIQAAVRGAHVHTITLSDNQRAYTAERAMRSGFSERITVELRDYRQMDGGAGEYDAILSVEMIEAVGRENWPGYFAALRRLLAPGGRIGLQAITMPHQRMTASSNTQTWITKYVFPGGLIPSVQAIKDNADRCGLRIHDDFAFGAHYAETLRLWRERFVCHADRLDALGFDETFRRTWELYLAYSQAGFASGYLDVHQFVLA
jgi:cyclopropane-fatty-acyl-phospholipid synthase